MPVEDKKIKHFILMRFFSFDDPNYPHDIYDPDFLSKQLVLAKNNAIPSLENQTNKNFNLAFIVNTKFFDNPKYEFVFSTLKESTTLPLTFIKDNERPRLIEESLNDYDFVITSRMDFDDFIYKDAIEDTHSKVNECENILAYGYCRGYTYVCGELYGFIHPYKRIGYHSVLGSVILKSSFAKNMPFIDAFGFNHGLAKNAIKSFVEKNGIMFSENMFQQNTSTKAIIYFRHEFAHWQLTKVGTSQVSPPANQVPLTDEEITKKQLADEFGFHLELKSIK